MYLRKTKTQIYGAGKEKEFYSLKTSSCTYYVEIYHQYQGMDKVYIRGKRKCVVFTVYTKDKTEAPNLDGFGISQECNKESTHERGIGSVHLLNIAMYFIIKHYNLSHDIPFYLKDTSYIECNRCTFPLSVYYMVYYGKTWYEKKFHATPTLLGEETLRQQKKNLRTYFKSKPHSLDEFFPTGDEKMKSIKQVVYETYESCSSIQECLDKLKNMDCSVLRNWVPKMVYKYIPNLYGMEWQIRSRKEPKNMTILQIDKRPDDMFIMTGGGLGSLHMF